MQLINNKNNKLFKKGPLGLWYLNWIFIIAILTLVIATIVVPLVVAHFTPKVPSAILSK